MVIYSGFLQRRDGKYDSSYVSKNKQRNDFCVRDFPKGCGRPNDVGFPCESKWKRKHSDEDSLDHVSFKYRRLSMVSSDTKFSHERISDISCGINAPREVSELVKVVEPVKVASNLFVPNICLPRRRISAIRDFPPNCGRNIKHSQKILLGAQHGQGNCLNEISLDCGSNAQQENFLKSIMLDDVIKEPFEDDKVPELVKVVEPATSKLLIETLPSKPLELVKVVEPVALTEALPNKRHDLEPMASKVLTETFPELVKVVEPALTETLPNKHLPRRRVSAIRDFPPSCGRSVPCIVNSLKGVALVDDEVEPFEDEEVHELKPTGMGFELLKEALLPSRRRVSPIRVFPPGCGRKGQYISHKTSYEGIALRYDNVQPLEDEEVSPLVKIVEPVGITSTSEGIALKYDDVQPLEDEEIVENVGITFEVPKQAMHDSCPSHGSSNLGINQENCMHDISLVNNTFEPFEDFHSHASTAMPILLKMPTVPQYEYVWQGDFEVHTSKKVAYVCGGIQSHLSTCSSPLHKILEVVNKFPHKVCLTEVSRLSTWPAQFYNSGVTEDNIALYFFSKDQECYERYYKILLESMLKNDLALKGNFDGVELLIFPSNHLPEQARRWNALNFLWGVFRAGK